MNELLKLFKESSTYFYIGEDEKAWISISLLTERIQLQFADQQSDINMMRVLTEFISKFELIEEMKHQKNYTLIGDILLSTYENLKKYKEFN